MARQRAWPRPSWAHLRGGNVLDLLPNPLPNLTVVGTGMKRVAHVILEALEAVRRCDTLLHVGADVVTRRWLEEQNATAEALPNHLPDQPRSATYAS